MYIHTNLKMNSLEVFEFPENFFKYIIPNTVKNVKRFTILFKAKRKTFSLKVRKIIKD